MFPKFRALPKTLTAFVDKYPLLSVLIVVAYIASPVDILPEIALGPLGAFDDALVGIAAVSLLKKAAKARAERRRLNPPPPKPAPAPAAMTEPIRQEKHQHWHGVRRDEGRGGGQGQSNDRRPDGRRPNDRGRGDRDRNRNRGGRPNRPGDRRP